MFMINYNRVYLILYLNAFKIIESWSFIYKAHVMHGNGLSMWKLLNSFQGIEYAIKNSREHFLIVQYLIG